MFDFRIAYSGFAGLNFVFTLVLERFARKLSLKQFLHNKSMYLNPHECKTPNLQLFSYSRKEHTDSTCYFYVNRRVRIAYSEYRIAYSEYHIPYTVYFYVNAALDGT